MALLSDPALLLLDEPTTGMDVEGRRAFWSAIRADAEQGRTVLFATHYLEEADQYADRIVLISHGRIVADGTGAEIKALAAGRTVRATLPGADTDALAALAGVDGVEVRGDTVLVHAKDSDAVARHLLTQTDAHDLEITSRGPRGRLPQPHRPTTTDDRQETTMTDRRPSTRPRRRVPPFGGFNRTLLGIELQADAAQPPHHHLHAGPPGRAVLRLRRAAGLERRRRPRQRRGVHPGLDGAVRRRADRRRRRRHGRHRAGAGLVAPAPADPAQPGRLHR